MVGPGPFIVGLWVIVVNTDENGLYTAGLGALTEENTSGLRMYDINLFF